MFRIKTKTIVMLVGVLGLFALAGLNMLRNGLHFGEEQDAGSYQSLAPDMSSENPLKYIHEDFSVDEDFHTNLPIVILTMDTDIPEYKTFKNGKEVVTEGIAPYITGSISIVDGGRNDNHLLDEPVYTSLIKLKKRGHTSFLYDKSQYLINLVDQSGTDVSADILKMGEGESWILNGSMADKSMIRNYLPYRIASEIDGNGMSPDSRFCEVLIEKDGTYEYSGVYLLLESIERGPSRVDIDKYKEKNIYSSYIVRRDRFTNFDPMLDTYGRLNGFSKEWIGLKYPSAARITEPTKQYIEKDFSRIEEILYSDKESVFKIYDKYIDIDSFVDYFLINEYFGNYDAGEHSTYMYKNSGDLLKIGPVWDFDQAMNNYFLQEMNSKTLAFQTKPIFDRLSKDHRFISALKDRYSELQKGVLSEEHVFAAIDEATDYLQSAREREWYRWAADYEEDSGKNIHNYYLQDYVKDGVTISRFNDNYNQEIYTIKNYLHQHSLIIQEQLTKLNLSAKYDTSLRSENGLFLFMVLILFFVPSFLINKRG